MPRRMASSINKTTESLPTVEAAVTDAVLWPEKFDAGMIARSVWLPCRWPIVGFGCCIGLSGVARSQSMVSTKKQRVSFLP